MPDEVAPASAVIAAAGSGERLGAGGPKAFVELGGRPLLEWSLDAFERAESVGSVIVAVPAGQEAAVRDGAIAVAGGASRSESVAEGLERVDAEIVAVHDAARPLVTPALIDELVAKLLDRPDAAAVIAAAPLTDTVKRAREPRPDKGDFPRGGPTVAQTVSRDHLWAAQTPQVFRTAALREALRADPQRIAAATDDAMLLEKAGGKVLIHPSPSANLKVTTRLDLQIAELLLSDRKR
ncbi:MAG: 2-C-methyl-D-erythritol 4-phosphate cytidylyltransferase [Actinobacteria bacterium]|nr:MAG: 2-C-methyl-D-erythritol 4-phosphate cytidylyltransferase [Actinomycetota bacterium]